MTISTERFCTACGVKGVGRFCAACGTPQRAPEAPVEVPDSSQPGGPESPGVIKRRFEPKTLVLPQAALRAGAAAGGVALLAQLAFLLVLVAVLSLALGEEGHRGSPVDWARAAVLLSVLALRGAVRVTAEGPAGEGEEFGFTTISTSFSASPLLLTIGAAVALYAWSRMSERRAPSTSWRDVVAASLATAVVFTLAHAVVAWSAAGSLGYGLTAEEVFDEPSSSLRITADLGMLTVTCFLVAGLSGLFGRSSAFLRRTLGTSSAASARRRSPEWAAAAAQAATLLTLTVIVGLFSSAAWVLYQSVTGEVPVVEEVQDSGPVDEGVRGALLLIVALVAFLPNLALLGGGATLGGTLGASGDSSGADLFGDGARFDSGFGLLAGGLPAPAYLILIPMLLVAATVGLRFAYRGQLTSSARAGNWWRVGLVHTLLWTSVALLTAAYFDVNGSSGFLGDGGAGGQGRAGLGLPSVALAAFAWGATSALLGSLLARSVGGTFPVGARRVAGKHIEPGWSLLLKDAKNRLHGDEPLLPSQTGTPELEPLRVKRGRAAVVLSALSLAVVSLAGIFVAAHLLSTRVLGPAAAVEDFLEAAAAGDVATALEAAGAPDADSPLLADELLADPANRISAPRVLSVETEEEMSFVSVVFQLDGREREANFVVQATDERRYLLFKKQALVDPLTEVEIAGGAGAGRAIDVNGVRLSVGNHDALPGRYLVRAAAADSTFTFSDATVLATGGGSFESVELSAQLSPEARTSVQQAVREQLDACARSTSVEPSGCPFEYFGFGDYENVDWTIVRYPTVSVRLDGSTIRFSASSGGTARFTAVERYEFLGDIETDEEVEFDVSGVARVSAGSTIVTFDAF